MSNVIPFDYEGHPVQLSTDGWLNATAISKKFGKRPSHWLELPTTGEYLGALAKRLSVGNSDSLIRRKMGRNGGVWLHPKLAVAFARWLSADFSVWCDLQIDSLLHGDVDVRTRYESACAALDRGKEVASLSGKELSSWRWAKPGLEHNVEYWRNQMQLTLKLEVA
ncbi:KilA-N domain-containing protein [Pseudomonas parafulva]|uniref:DNA-binding protein n=1 Tax=Pseudomonas parafulva TaxID=157782 RepID=A0ABN4XZJ0_9PSED|nr:KilA-N domain-containing protein [Pseudomonas parafulva]AQW68389.1 DNA-binding protein [Pseudomonas parafulva]